MKKLTLILTASLLFTSLASAQVANQSSGQIKLRGVVTKSSCSLNPVIPVDLGSISQNSLKADGQGAGWGYTSIEFVDCEVGTGEDAVSAVHLAVQPGASANANNALWANTAQSGASNVGVEVEIDNKKVTPLGSDDLLSKKISKNGLVTFNVAGRIVATGKAEPGLVESTINFIANYK